MSSFGSLVGTCRVCVCVCVCVHPDRQFVSGSLLGRVMHVHPDRRFASDNLVGRVVCVCVHPDWRFASGSLVGRGTFSLVPCPFKKGPGTDCLRTRA